jgi:hypothetical protein
MVINYLAQEIARIKANKNFLPIKSELEDCDMPIGRMNDEEKAIMSLHYISGAYLNQLISESESMPTLAEKEKYFEEINEIYRDLDFLNNRLANSLKRFGPGPFFCRRDFVVVKKIVIFEIKRRVYCPCEN